MLSPVRSNGIQDRAGWEDQRANEVFSGSVFSVFRKHGHFALLDEALGVVGSGVEVSVLGSTCSTVSKWVHRFQKTTPKGLCRVLISMVRFSATTPSRLS